MIPPETSSGLRPRRSSLQRSTSPGGARKHLYGLHALGNVSRVPLFEEFDHAHRRDREEGRDDPPVPGGRPARAGHRPAAGRACRSSAAAKRIATAIPPSSSAPARPRRRTSPSRSAAHFGKAEVEPKAKVAEFRVAEDALLDVGAHISADHFVAGQIVDISGVTQGKGFAGAMKRWGFGGLRATHGVSVSHRSHGSTGQAPGSGHGLQEQEDGRPHGRPQSHPAESRDRPHRRRSAACSSSRARCPVTRAAG